MSFFHIPSGGPVFTQELIHSVHHVSVVGKNKIKLFFIHIYKYLRDSINSQISDSFNSQTLETLYSQTLERLSLQILERFNLLTLEKLNPQTLEKLNPEKLKTQFRNT